MELRNLGSSGLRVSALGLGCNNFGWQIDIAAARAVLHKALDLGITHYDTADVYGAGGSESMLGELLGDRRKDVVVATKVGMKSMNVADGCDLSRRHVIAAVEASLKRLRTDWIDVLYPHQPDAQTPLEETLRAMDDLVHQGKVRYIACCNLPAWRVMDGHWIAKEAALSGFIATQSEYSLLRRAVEDDMLPMLKRTGLGLIPYFPLASGLLTGKYKRDAAAPEGSRIAKLPGLGSRYLSDKTWATIEGLSALSAKHGKELIDLALSWLIARPGVSSVIAGATKPEQVERNVKGASWALDASVVAEVDKLTRP
jgi:aryl-alcohol dehydrogenase-like predicted oxidoreductase